MSTGTAAGFASRRVAWQIIRRVTRDGAWTGPAVDRALTNSTLDRRDRAFATNLAFQTLRWQGTLDWALRFVVRRPLEDVEPDLLDVLRMGAWELLYGQTPDRAAVSTAVELARAVQGARAVGFVNGVLRGLARRRAALPWPSEDSVEGRALALGYPEWIVAEADTRFADQATRELEAGNQPAALTVRAVDPDTTRARLAKEGIAADAGDLAPEALHVTGVAPAQLIARHGDLLVIQDASSMVVAHTVAQALAGGARVLDACAAPGGKSTHLAQLGLRVVAADRNAVRLGLVGELATRLSVQVDTAVADATAPPWRPQSFDGVLVDAPCTGLGVRRHPEVRWRRSAADVTTLAALQQSLLRATVDAVAPGGTLVYSVCTWTTAETVDVVEQFLRRHPEFSLESVDHRLDSAARGPGLQLSTGQHGSDGMYIAVLRRAPDGGVASESATSPTATVN